MVKKMTPESLDQEGKEFFQKKDYIKAAESFANAAQAFRQKKNSLMAAEMINNQCVALLQGKKAQQALDVVSGTEMVFAKAGDLRRQGMALANQASALDSLKRNDEALSLYEKAAEILGQAGEDQLRADVMRSAAALNARKGKGIDALIAMQEGLSGVKKPTQKQKFFKKILRMRLW